MAKYNLSLRIQKVRDDNEFLADDIVYLQIQNKPIRQLVKIINLALDSPLPRVKQPNFELFEGKGKKAPTNQLPPKGEQ